MALLIVSTSGAVAWAQEADAASDAAAAEQSAVSADKDGASDAAINDGASEEAAAEDSVSDSAVAAAESETAPVVNEVVEEAAAATPVVVHLSNVPEDDENFVPYAGTAFSYGNNMAPYSLAKKGYLSYNPFYAMDFGFKLSWWFNKHLNIYGGLSVNRELTQSDITTFKNEALVSDTTIGLTYHNVYMIPVVGIDINLGAKLVIPTSKASRADTSIVDLGVDLTLVRKFKVLKGLQISYSLAPKYNFHRYTTGESVAPRVAVSAKDKNYDALLSNGTRNVQFDLGNDISFNLAFTDWLGFGFSWGRIICWLYDLSNDGDLAFTGLNNQSLHASYGVKDPTNRRYIDYFNIYLTGTVVEFLDITLMASTAYAQLGMDGTYKTPFFNDQTTLTLDLTFNFGAMGQYIKNHKKK